MCIEIAEYKRHYFVILNSCDKQNNNTQKTKVTVLNYYAEAVCSIQYERLL